MSEVESAEEFWTRLINDVPDEVDAIEARDNAVRLAAKRDVLEELIAALASVRDFEEWNFHADRLIIKYTPAAAKEEPRGE